MMLRCEGARALAGDQHIQGYARDLGDFLKMHDVRLCLGGFPSPVAGFGNSKSLGEFSHGFETGCNSRGFEAAREGLPVGAHGLGGPFGWHGPIIAGSYKHLTSPFVGCESAVLLFLTAHLTIC